jgi:crotonobetainyl-CoA:carnitine CoA-transferase CaiB-like acyl-CoA transferase
VPAGRGGRCATATAAPHDDGGPHCCAGDPSAFAAFVAAAAIAAALHARDRTGAGRLVRVPLFDATYQALGFLGLRIERSGASVHEVPAWDGQYRCADGRWVHPVITQRRRSRALALLRAKKGSDPERLRRPR